MFNSLLTKESANLHHLKFFTLIHFLQFLKWWLLRKLREESKSLTLVCSSKTLAFPLYLYPFSIPVLTHPPIK